MKKGVCVMLKYREFLSLTDEEVKSILTDIFNPVKIENIQRDKTVNEITATITTGGWDDGITHDFEVEDDITMTAFNIYAPFLVSDDDTLLYRQFLLAKGCDERLKNNPYLSEGR